MFQLSEKATRWIVFCSSMRKRNVTEVRRKAPHSSSQGTHLRKEKRRHIEDRRSTIKLHLRHANQSGPKDLHGNRSKRKQNSESSISTGRRKLRHLLHSQPTEAQKLQLLTTSHQRLTISHFGSEDKTDRC